MSSKTIGAGAQIAVMPPESDLEMCAVEVKLLGLTVRVFSEHEWLCPVSPKSGKRIHPTVNAGRRFFSGTVLRLTTDDA
jgi:hypothetical protein